MVDVHLSLDLIHQIWHCIIEKDAVISKENVASVGEEALEYHISNLKFFELQQLLLAAAGQAFNPIVITPLLHVNLMSVTFPLMFHAERSYQQVR